MRLLLLVAGLAMGLACAAPSATHPQDAPVTIFAAASLQGALDEVDARVLRPAGVATRLTYAGTPQLARQIDAGAPADLFIAADDAWMDQVASAGHVRPDSRVVLLGNTLVLIAPASSTTTVTLARETRLREALGDGRFAIADPDSVPAGRYARQALERLALWPQVADRLAPHENVRAALAIVARAEAPLGMVYASDAHDEPRVRIVARVPTDTHGAIRYPAAVTTTAGPRAGAVLARLRAPDASAIFVRHGFVVPGS